MAMLTAKKSKRGRKTKHYVHPETGKQIYGLGHDAKSGRWRIIGSNKFFREADPAKAIERFRRMTSHQPTVREQIARGAYLPEHVSTFVGKMLAAISKQ